MNSETNKNQHQTNIIATHDTKNKKKIIGILKHTEII